MVPVAPSTQTRCGARAGRVLAVDTGAVSHRQLANSQDRQLRPPPWPDPVDYPVMKSGPAPPPPASRPPTERLNTRAAGIIGLAVMCSRILGLIREQVFAALFGGGWALDAFIAAFRIPNLLRDLFAEGALSTAFITIFSKTAARDSDAAAWHLANKVATMAAVVLGALCLLGICFSPQLVATLAPGFDPAKAALTVTLTRIMFPFILLVSLAALLRRRLTLLRRVARRGVGGLRRRQRVTTIRAGRRPWRIPGHAAVRTGGRLVGLHGRLL